MTRLIALDVGDARIGVAVSDSMRFLASPYTTLYVDRGNEAKLWAEIQRCIDETEAGGLVIGLPISLDGQIHAQGERVQAFAERLRQHMRRKGHEIDAMAATVILQEYLDALGRNIEETTL